MGDVRRQLELIRRERRGEERRESLMEWGKGRGRENALYW